MRTGPPPRSVLDVIRRGGVPYPYGEIEHDVIAALIRGSRSLTSAILTIAPDRDGRPALWVALRNADGTPGPARKVSVDQDVRLAAFAVAMQALAGLKLTAIESSTIESAADGD